jgi:UDP-N-acetylmuramoylalanine--D-glutamate ligase
MQAYCWHSGFKVFCDYFCGIVIAMRIGIVGWGLEGQSAFNYFGPNHEYLIVNEQPPSNLPPQSDKIKVQYLDKEKPAGITGNVADLSYLDGLEQCDKIIYSPTARKNLERKFGDSPEFWNKATTERHIFFENVKTTNIIGVTGTKGKGTTSTLVFQMLQAAGKRAYLGGNIGRSVLDFLNDVTAEDWVVLELSNFQLYKFPYSPHVAVCLMLTPEHLDWHPNMEDYIEAKANIFTHQKPNGLAIYFDSNKYSRQLAYRSAGIKIPYYQTPGARVREDGKIVITEAEVEIIHKDEVKLLGEHNLQNICAAITAVWFGLTDQGNQSIIKAIRQVLTTFTGLEHRLEFVRELNGVKYYDDSFGTTPETAIVAMETFKSPKIMILGGSDKGQDFEELSEEVIKNNVRHVIAIGKTGPKITGLLHQKGFNNITEGLQNMSDVVQAVKNIASAGDVVLLSCADASFDMFKDYKDRGNQFKQAVQVLV